MRFRHDRLYWQSFLNWLGDAARSVTTRQRQAAVAFVVLIGAALLGLNVANATGSGDLGNLVSANAAIWLGVLAMCMCISARVRS